MAKLIQEHSEHLGAGTKHACDDTLLKARLRLWLRSSSLSFRSQTVAKILKSMSDVEEDMRRLSRALNFLTLKSSTELCYVLTLSCAIPLSYTGSGSTGHCPSTNDWMKTENPSTGAAERLKRIDTILLQPCRKAPGGVSSGHGWQTGMFPEHRHQFSRYTAVFVSSLIRFCQILQSLHNHEFE
ncbi:hypothetical protein AC579_10460 [Pseudocercospora musae]|uniref:Uncharacterized protein n=1 Tax=Pseudocercospora musae TaxID=113226 RepID=A0A139IDT2_9PEZI|nr:hypothetical protein AC579_10460 [Pseudocercospora musae]